MKRERVQMKVFLTSKKIDKMDTSTHIEIKKKNYKVMTEKRIQCLRLRKIRNVIYPQLFYALKLIKDQVCLVNLTIFLVHPRGILRTDYSY